MFTVITIIALSLFALLLVAGIASLLFSEGSGFLDMIIAWQLIDVLGHVLGAIAVAVIAMMGGGDS